MSCNPPRKTGGVSFGELLYGQDFLFQVDLTLLLFVIQLHCKIMRYYKIMR